MPDVPLSELDSLKQLRYTAALTLIQHINVVKCLGISTIPLNDMEWRAETSGLRGAEHRYDYLTKLVKEAGKQHFVASVVR